MAVTRLYFRADSTDRAVFEFMSDEYIRPDRVGVAVRSSGGANLDYPGNIWSEVNVGPDGFIFTSSPRDPLPDGTYDVWGFYRLDGSWRAAGPVETLVVEGGAGMVEVGASDPEPDPEPEPEPDDPCDCDCCDDEPEPDPEPDPEPEPDSKFGKPLHWGDEFTDGLTPGRWVNARTSAFPNMGPVNPGDNKLSYLNPNAVTFSDGVMKYTATKRSEDQYWDTGLITTERADEASGIGFELRPGDYWETRFRLPSLKGAWFSVWAWGRDNPPGWDGVQPGHGEIDKVEYHWDNPDLLELSNHVRDAGKYHRDSAQIGHGKWVTLGVLLGESSCDWYLNDGLIFQDGRGVPSYWRGWPILELAVVAGEWHPAPDHTNPITCEFDWTRVYR